MANIKKESTLDTHILSPIPGHAITLAEEKLQQQMENFSEERDLANQLLGQVEMASTFSKVLTVTSLSKLAYIKENKLYRALKGKKIGNGYQFDGTWDGYCTLLGLSREKVDLDLANLSAFGEDALESLGRIGAGYRDLRKLRKLPEDVRSEVIGQLVNLDDKEEVVALIDELAAKHTREKDALTKEVEELKADAEVVGKVVEDKNKKIDALEMELHRLRSKTKDWHPRAFAISLETTTRGAQVLEGLDALDALRTSILEEDFGEADREAALEAMAMVYYDTVSHLVDRVAEVMLLCDDNFIGYKEKARPLLSVFDPANFQANQE